MTLENEIIAHYARKEPAEIKAGTDHLHIGGEKATGFVLSKMDLSADMRVLDIGCGVGGPAIYAAENFGCFVTGIDLTPDYIELAREKTALGPHRDKLYFEIANATKLDFKDARFDAAYMLHTGMNIEDKQSVYHEVSRVLKQGGVFAIYDILALQNVADMIYPCPWAATQETSFLESFESIERQLRNAGLSITHSENCHTYGINAMTKMLDVMGDSLSANRRHVVTNLLENLKSECCAPFIILARKAA